MISKDIVYRSGEKEFTGYLADGSNGKPAPGILVCHQGGGLTEHTKARARMLAELGYVGFALDMYGVVAATVAEAMPLMHAVLADPPEMRRRALAGLDTLKAQQNVDGTRLAAIGYCFGGALVLELARCAPDFACVVAFHPGMAEPVPLPEKDDRKVLCKIMVCAGADDPFIPAAAREKFAQLMKDAGADWQMLVYGGAGHSFTDKSVDALNLPGFNYDAATDRRSWAAMRGFFGEVFDEVAG